jgi:hypothetical protein
LLYREGTDLTPARRQASVIFDAELRWHLGTASRGEANPEPLSVIMPGAEVSRNYVGDPLYVWSYRPPFGGWANPSLVSRHEVRRVEYFDEPSGEARTRNPQAAGPTAAHFRL